MLATLDADDRYELIVAECPSGHSSRPVVDLPPQLVRRYARLHDQIEIVEAEIAAHLVITGQVDSVLMGRSIASLVRNRAEDAP